EEVEGESVDHRKVQFPRCPPDYLSESRAATGACMKNAGCDIIVCDIMVRKYLPAMRAEMVTRLVQREGITQSDAAKMLGVSRAAVSQYMSRKRGDSGVEISHELDSLIDQWALSVTSSDTGITLCDICRCAMKR